MSLLDGPLLLHRGLFRARQTVRQSNLLFVSDIVGAIETAARSVLVNRALLEDYSKLNPTFVHSLVPMEVEENAPRAVRLASDAAFAAQVGPFAAVPGAIADLALEEMRSCRPSVCLVENGGEIAADSKTPLNVGVYAGVSPISGRVGFRLDSDDFPIGIATSSASVSHAISLGEADAAVAIADTAALSDACATAICNAVSGDDVEGSVQTGLEVAEAIPNLRGAFVVRGEHVGSVGRLPRFLRLNGRVDEMFRSALVD